MSKRNARPFAADKAQFIVVEGHSDLRFLAEFLEHLGVAERAVDIYESNGMPELVARLDGLIDPGVLERATHIAIVVDGDRTPESHFRLIQTALTRLTKQTVSAPGIWTTGKPALGVFVCPDGVRNGEMEDLAWEAWAGQPGNAAKAGCVEAFLDCMNGKGATVSDLDRAKARVGATFAVLHPDDPRLGPAAQQKLIPFDHPALAGLKAFLTPLAGAARGLSSTSRET